MLVEFRVENHRSVRDEQALTMESGRIGAEPDREPRPVLGADMRLLPVAALYGANASGKSNFLSALAFMRDAVLHSHRSWPPEGGVPREPFAWNQRPAEPSLFQVTILLDGIRYEYGFAASDTRFIEEWLYSWPLNRKQVWFEREGDDFKFGEHLRGENKVVEQVTRPNALFLAAAVQHRHEQLMPIYNWFRALQPVAVPVRRRRFVGPPLELWLARFVGQPSAPDQLGLFADEPAPPKARFDAFRDLLRAADVGIVDVKIVRDEQEEGLRSERWRRGVRVLLQHQQDNEQAWLPLEEESNGTLTLFRLAPAVLDALWTGGVIIVDELEASLHPLLGIHIVRLFNDPEKNPKNAQLIFTTHDTNLLGTTLGTPVLRRDQIWLTEKDQEGSSRIYPLTDYKPRKAENIERGYLQGRYGAIPFLGDFSALED